MWVNKISLEHHLISSFATITKYEFTDYFCLYQGQDIMLSLFRSTISKHTGVLYGARWMSLLEGNLKEHFNKVMKQERTPLFSCFEDYKKSLPVRDHTNGKLSLYTIPHWTYDEDIESMAKEILQPPRSSRFGVKYLSAPGGSGKTSSILPAFLRSTKMVNGYTLYLLSVSQ